MSLTEILVIPISKVAHTVLKYQWHWKCCCRHGRQFIANPNVLLCFVGQLVYRFKKRKVQM